MSSVGNTLTHTYNIVIATGVVVAAVVTTTVISAGK